MNILSTVSKLARRLGLPNQRFISISKTLRSGEALVAGDVKIELLDRKRGEMSVMVSVGGGLAVLLNLDDRDGLPVQCYSDGQRIPRIATESTENTEYQNKKRVSSESPVTSVAKPLPLCRFGPGGDYTRDWPDESAIRNTTLRSSSLRSASPQSAIARGVQPA